MNDCEIIDNTACGKPFKYCRTHKTEPQDCPGAGMANVTLVPRRGADFEIAPRYQRRGLCVGDRVRLVDRGVHTHLAENLISTIKDIRDAGSCHYRDGTTNTEPLYFLDATPSIVWTRRCLELA